jgi:NADH:ubiquinone oxidoreductase subunit 5 (subunit L)/multisubunit Na+/H+ antiporter MnhA subunit
MLIRKLYCSQDPDPLFIQWNLLFDIHQIKVRICLMGDLRKYVPITRTTFLCGTPSLCGIPPLACFWSKDEILSNSWLYSPFFRIIASFTAGLTAFYMF